MKKVILAPDSFKGTMCAREVCAIVSEEVKKCCPDAEVICVPMSDGGEGMSESYVSLIGGVLKNKEVTGPLGWFVDAEYGILPDGTAVMEMASCAGLPLVKGNLQPLHATTWGVGELMMHILGQGSSRFLIGLGGSATNDGGIGMADALGYRFLDEEGRRLAPYAWNLARVERIVPPEKMPALTVTAACDVNNPLCGPRGAAAVFGPQKGLLPEQIAPHDAAMAHFAEVIKRELGRDVKDVPGAGAAGGLGAGMLAFADAELKPGIELLLDSVGFDRMLQGADLVITGEGRLDGQSLAGKVPVGVARRAKAKGVPCIALCGCIGPEAEQVRGCGIDAYYASSDGSRSFEEVKKSCREDLAALAAAVLPKHFTNVVCAKMM